MNLINHLNLLTNHKYDGFIAIYTGPSLLSTEPGDIVMVRTDGDKIATIEKPLSQEQIDKNQSQGSGIKTICTCVSVPLRYLERIYT